MYPWLRVILLQDYNTRVVVTGAAILGLVAGTVGVFAVLRKKALLGDVVGHASLPGIALAFIVLQMVNPDYSRSVGALLLGATLAGLAGILCTAAIRRWTRIKEDAALSIVLSVFFGMGMVLFTVIQAMPAGKSAGLNRFIFGSAASLLASDVWLIIISAVVVLSVCLLLFKELALVCFDENFAAVSGWPTRWLDLLLMGLIVAVAELGAQCVGLILVAALMIIPAAAARFWTDRIVGMALIAGAIGAASAYIGVMISALAPRLPAGAIVILVGGLIFVGSLLFGIRRGVLWQAWSQHLTTRRIGEHDLLRAIYEILESQRVTAGVDFSQPVNRSELALMRKWTVRRLSNLLAQASRQGLVEKLNADTFRLSRLGQQRAAAAVRQHRLWELYLIHYASIAPTHVDRDADEMEHLLAPALVAELERILADQTGIAAVEQSGTRIPQSPHQIHPAREVVGATGQSMSSSNTAGTTP